MKQKDIILIIVIVFISGVFSYLVSNMLFGSTEQRQQEVEVVEAITSEFTQPDSKYFNAQSINPTQLIEIGDNQNTAPFNQ
jgi:hypothetical protein